MAESEQSAPRNIRSMLDRADQVAEARRAADRWRIAAERGAAALNGLQGSLRALHAPAKNTDSGIEWCLECKSVAPCRTYQILDGTPLQTFTDEKGNIPR